MQNTSLNIEDLSFEEVDRLADLGLLYDELLPIYKYVKNGMVGDLELWCSSLQKLPTWLLKVDGVLDIRSSKIIEIPEYLKITKDICADNSSLKNFSKSIVHGNLCLNLCHIIKMPNTLEVRGDLYIRYAEFEEFPEYLTVLGDLYMFSDELNGLTESELRNKYQISGHIYILNKRDHLI